MSNKEVVKKPKSRTRKIIEWILTGFFVAIFAIIAAGTIDGMIQKKNNYNETLRFGWGSFIVKTDSMEPLYMKGSAIITHKDDVEDVYECYIKNKSEIEKKSDTVYIDVIFKDIANEAFFKPSNPEWFDNTTGSSGGLSMTHRLREVIYRPEIPFGEGRYVFIVSGINTGGHLAQKGQYQEFTEKQYLGVVKVHSEFLGGVFNFITSVWGLLVLLLIPAIYLIITSSIDIFKTLKESEEAETTSTNTSVNNENAGVTTNKISSLSDKDRERLKRELLEQMIAEKQKLANEQSKNEVKETENKSETNDEGEKE